MKLGFVYAGQGSQHAGMGKDLYEEFAAFREVFDGADLDFDLKKLCFEGPEETLAQTRYTQPCMVAFAAGVTNLFRTEGIEPAMAAGLSLGEYSALYAAGVLDEGTVIPLAAFRGQAMEDAVKGVESKMVAVMGMERERLEEICREASALGVVKIANYNCPGQLVVGGEKAAVEKACEAAGENGAKRCIPLKVSGPFHTPLLEPASAKLAERFKTTKFHDMRFPVIFNATAKPLEEGKTVADMLTVQVKSSVYFEDTVRLMIDEGVDTFVEIGPGKALTGFIKKIDRSVSTYRVEDAESFHAVVKALKGERDEISG